MKLVGVIVPIYNVESYLDHCIQSIVGQTYENLEIILVDDGSSDNCGYICDAWAEKDQRIKVIHKENGGVSDARNTGLTISTGDYICFVDADDYVSPFLIEKLVGNSISNGITVCNYSNVSVNDTMENPQVAEKTFSVPLMTIKDLTKYRKGLFCWGILFPKELIMQKPEILFDSQLINLEDAVWMGYILTRVKQIVFVDWDNPLYYYMSRKGALTQKCVDTNWQAASWIMARKSVEDIKNKFSFANSDVQNKSILKQLSRYCLNNFYGECVAGNLNMSEIKKLCDRPATEAMIYKLALKVRNSLKR